jgi:glycerophosphoryl diester phosphodiesterase
MRRALSAMILPAFDIQGHRGAPHLRPENTLASFEAALDGGATSLECDVHVTADGVPVLCHDPWVETAAGRRFVRDLTLAECSRPSLTDLYEFVRRYAGRRTKPAVVVDVEVKRYPYEDAGDGRLVRAIEEAVVAVIRTAGMNPAARQETRVRSFDHRTVRRLVDAEPRLTGVAIVEGTAPVDLAAVVRAAGAKIYGPDFRFLDEEQVRQCHAAGIAVIPWTVNDPADWARLVAWDVDGITTDYPDRLAAFLASGVA